MSSHDSLPPRSTPVSRWMNLAALAAAAAHDRRGRDDVVADDDGELRRNEIHPAVGPLREPVRVLGPIGLAIERASGEPARLRLLAGRRPLVAAQHRRMEAAMDEKPLSGATPERPRCDGLGERARELGAVRGGSDLLDGSGERAPGKLDAAAGYPAPELVFMISGNQLAVAPRQEVEHEANRAWRVRPAVDEVAER